MHKKYNKIKYNIRQYSIYLLSKNLWLQRVPELVNGHKQ